MSTARQQICERRQSFVYGMQRATEILGFRWTPAKEKTAQDAAADEIPFPRYARPRILKIPNTNPSTASLRPFAEYKVEGGMLYYRFPAARESRNTILDGGENWKPTYNETPETLAAKIELFRAPTEEVEIP